jgi:5-methylthioadenosine/S-adenosylhomocysteine deaminase
MLLELGVNVAIGTDSASLNQDEDLWNEMRLGWYLHRLPGMYPGWPSSGSLLRMATVNGAKIACPGKCAATLAPGRRADFIQVRAPRLGVVEGLDASSIQDLLLARTTRRDVTAVVVNGDVLMRDGHLVHLDRKKIQEEACRAARSSSSEKRALAQLTAELVPYVEAFYQDWEARRLDPVYKPNSCT